MAIAVKSLAPEAIPKHRGKRLRRIHDAWRSPRSVGLTQRLVIDGQICRRLPAFSRPRTIREDFLPLIDRLPRNPYLFGLGLN